MMKQALSMGTPTVGAQLPKLRQSLSHNFGLVMTFCMAIAMFATTTQAQWGSHGGGGSNGSYGAAGYGSNGGYGYAGGYSGGSTGGHGHVRRLAARIHDHHASRHDSRHRVGYGSTGGCGPIGGYSVYSNGSNGGYGSNPGYGSTGGYSTYGGYGSPMGYGSNGGFSSSYRGASDSSLNTRSSSVVTHSRSQLGSTATQSSVARSPIHLTVAVPTEARLFVNDRPTTTLGATRHFTSRDLEQGNQYGFRVRAEIMDKDGKWISETQQISMRAGDSETMKFTFPEQPQLLAALQRN